MQPSADHPPADHGLRLLKPEAPRYRWYHKFAAVMATVFCFELGMFLLIFPWVNDWNGAAIFLPLDLRPWWTNPYLRGAISGLGLLNIYISLSEVVRLRHFSR